MKRLVAGIALVLVLVTSPARAAEPQVDRKKAAEANAQLALAYMRQGDLTTARDKMEKAMEQDPHSATTQLAAGFIYDQLGEDRKAESHFEQALELSRDDPIVMNSYGVFLCLKVDKQRGEALLLKAAVSPLNRDPGVAYSNAGRCARADGRPKDAEKYFRQALNSKVDQPIALYEMASLEHELGNDLQARAFLERYLSVVPVSAPALWLGYQIERTLGDAAQAARYAERIRRDFPMSEEMNALIEAEKTRK